VSCCALHSCILKAPVALSVVARRWRHMRRCASACLHCGRRPQACLEQQHAYTAATVHCHVCHLQYQTGCPRLHVCDWLMSHAARILVWLFKVRSSDAHIMLVVSCLHRGRRPWIISQLVCSRCSAGLAEL
jgi:hypothetical protein